MWGKHHRRIYGRLMTGIEVARLRNEKVYFLTLTTSKEAKEIELQNSFKELVKKIKRHYGRFDYLRIRTPEGNGVLHILYRGIYLEARLIRLWWSTVHKLSVQLKIKEADTSSPESTQKLTSYLVRNYLLKHEGLRMSSSPSWTLVPVWQLKAYIKDSSYEEGVHHYKTMVRKLALANVQESKQMKFDRNVSS